MPRTNKSAITQDQYQTLLDRLDELGRVQNEIMLELASRKHIDEKVNDIDKMLVGNGKWGFVKLRDWTMSADEDNRYYRRFAITMAATNIVSLGIAAFFWFVKVLPVIEQLQKAGF